MFIHPNSSRFNYFEPPPGRPSGAAVSIAILNRVTKDFISQVGSGNSLYSSSLMVRNDVENNVIIPTNDVKLKCLGPFGQCFSGDPGAEASIRSNNAKNKIF